MKKHIKTMMSAACLAIAASAAANPLAPPKGTENNAGGIAKDPSTGKFVNKDFLPTGARFVLNKKKFLEENEDFVPLIKEIGMANPWLAIYFWNDLMGAQVLTTEGSLTPDPKEGEVIANHKSDARYGRRDGNFILFNVKELKKGESAYGLIHESLHGLIASGPMHQEIVEAFTAEIRNNRGNYSRKFFDDLMMNAGQMQSRYLQLVYPGNNYQAPGNAYTGEHKAALQLLLRAEADLGLRCEISASLGVILKGYADMDECSAHFARWSADAKDRYAPATAPFAKRHPELHGLSRYELDNAIYPRVLADDYHETYDWGAPRWVGAAKAKKHLAQLSKDYAKHQDLLAISGQSPWAYYRDKALSNCSITEKLPALQQMKATLVEALASVSKLPEEVFSVEGPSSEPESAVLWADRLNIIRLQHSNGDWSKSEDFSIKSMGWNPAYLATDWGSPANLGKWIQAAEAQEKEILDVNRLCARWKSKTSSKRK